MTDVPTGAQVKVSMPAIPSVSVPVLSAAAVTVLPVPGPRGADGADLTPADMAALTGDVTASVNASLEPPVDLVVWFNNQLL